MILETNKKELYISPDATSFDVETEGVICDSLSKPSDYSYGGDPFDPEP